MLAAGEQTAFFVCGNKLRLLAAKRDCVYFYPQVVDNVERMRKHHKYKENKYTTVFAQKKNFFVDNVEKLVNNLYFIGVIVNCFVDNVTNLKTARQNNGRAIG